MGKFYIVIFQQQLSQISPFLCVIPYPKSAKSPLQGSVGNISLRKDVISNAVDKSVLLREVMPSIDAVRWTWTSSGMIRSAGEVFFHNPRSTMPSSRTIQRLSRCIFLLAAFRSLFCPYISVLKRSGVRDSRES